ncbi:deoxyribose-phosphate aldolase [Candidatus Cyanaurora vandensis]|uniref:deoxyribose-phosphate aldolase n=1 Tax=Candidatus Cyanaurora vandensis TaxID=2714958 RepID=UPI00257D6699|nr:deoxyribose-phosphate aldolase [Candidatus Cyanaurora vandensis]
MVEIHPEMALPQFIEHTCLNVLTTTTTVEQVCWEADRHRFRAVCVPPLHLATAVKALYKKPIQVWTVVGFPLGLDTPQAKLYAAQQLADQGATGLEVVPQLIWLKQGDPNRVYQELAEIQQATRLPVRAILELNLLEPAELELALQVCRDAGVSGIKTGTGWAGNTTADQVRQVASLSKGRLPIKASGGIKTLAQCLDLLAAGATALGTSQGVMILKQQQERVL